MLFCFLLPLANIKDPIFDVGALSAAAQMLDRVRVAQQVNQSVVLVKAGIRKGGCLYHTNVDLGSHHCMD